jgi:tetratricopeptide (TPR) repeat protein
MADAPPRSNPPPRAWLLDALLAAHKAGRLDEVAALRPRLTQALARRWLGTVHATAGDRLPAPPHEAQATTLLLRWALTQLRPDQAPTLEGIDRSAWLERTSWRPLLALLCHFGFVAVPPFRDRYHARADEAPADVLCGLWSVGPSTYYRYLDKGRRLLLDVLRRPADGARALSLRHWVQRETAPAHAPADALWHRARLQRCATAAQWSSALWHALQAGDAAGFNALLQRAPVALANDAETDLLCAELEALNHLDARTRFDLALAQATLWRIRQSADRERTSFEQALRIAAEADDALMLGVVYGELGKFHEARDGDRAFACYEDSAQYLRRAVGDEAARAYAATLVRMAWMHVLRNDPRSRAVLDSAQGLSNERDLQPDLLAMLEQAWGEYWRRAGDLRRALSHKHRALNQFERLGDTRSQLVTYLNLSLIYGQLREFDRAIAYSQRVLTAAQREHLEPEMVASTHLNLGATCFWQDRLRDAIEHYLRGLKIAKEAGLALHLRRAHYNLAEAHYKLFQTTLDPEHERVGDAHGAAALALAQQEGDPARSDAARRLKSEVLGVESGANPDRLLPQEFAAHFDEMADVQRQRALLAVPIEPAAHVRAHLAIARAYLGIAAKEREAALSLIQKHGLSETFGDEFAQLRSTFERELTREQRLAARWQQAASDLLADERRREVLAELLRTGSINKSAYAKVCGLGLATASKHLGELATRGLVAQTGKGPATRYRLPADH